MKPKLNIAVRLVLGNTLAIIAVVVAYGYFNLNRIESMFSIEAKRQTESRMEDLQERGIAEAKRVATNTAFALLNNDYGYLINAIHPLVEADPGLYFTFILDRDHVMVAKGSQSNFDIPTSVIQEEKQRTDLLEETRRLSYNNHKILVVSVPIRKNEQSWGRVVLGYSLKRITEQMAHLDRLRREESHRLMVATLVFAAVLSILGILATVLPTVSATRPILTLTRAAEQLAAGDLGITVDVRTSGELGLLGATFNRMSAQLAALVDEVKTRASIEKELEVAELVQEAIIPSPQVHRVGGVEILGRYIPASRCGGDWWSFFPISSHRTLILVGDVTGHGLPTTLITASVNACCDILQRTNEEIQQLPVMGEAKFREYVHERRSLSYLLGHLNRTIAKVGRSRFMMTFSAAVIDTKAETLRYASAGHEPPLLIPKDMSKDIEPIHIGPSARLGESSTTRFREVTIPFSTGDSLVWYTDGLIDASNLEHKSFGLGRVVRNLRKTRKASVDRVSESVVNGMLSFSKGVARQDDMTVVIARNTSSPKPPGGPHDIQEIL